MGPLEGRGRRFESCHPDSAHILILAVVKLDIIKVYETLVPSSNLGGGSKKICWGLVKWYNIWL